MHAEALLGAMPAHTSHENRNVRVAISTAALDYCVYFYTAGAQAKSGPDAKLQALSLMAQVLATDGDTEVGIS